MTMLPVRCVVLSAGELNSMLRNKATLREQWLGEGVSGKVSKDLNLLEARILEAYLAWRHIRMMTPKLREHFERELLQSAEAEARGDLPASWTFLERAHILGQAHAGAHLRVHGRMFTFAWRRGDMHELLGQVPRLLLAGPGSLFGRAPLGNTGGARVGIFTPMPIPEDLQALLREARLPSVSRAEKRAP